MHFHSPKRRVPLAAFAGLVAASLLTGCTMVSTAPDTNTFSTAGTMSGKLHGGNQPISGAAVKLYAVGTSGYGSAGTLLASTTSANDGYGSFSFTQNPPVPTSLGAPNGPTPITSTYSCPSSSTLLYIIANGGNTVGTGSSVNTAATFLAAVGACGSAGSAYVNMNEITSTASIFALAQYINPGTSTPGSASVGSPNTAQAKLGLTNAFATVANLATLATGFPVSANTVTASGANITNATVTITPESSKLISIADILAACVNNPTSAASACTTLFANAIAPPPAITSQPSATFPTAVDTLQAGYYMAVNPTDGSVASLTSLYNLSTGTPPFVGGLTAQPTDWTLGIVFSTPLTTLCTGGSTFINYGYAISIDASGNLWMANGNGATSGVAEISPTGTPLACSDIAYNKVRGGAVIDTAGNIWTTSDGAAVVYKFNGTTTTTIPMPAGSTFSYGIAADGFGNVFFSDPTGLKLYELPSTATATTVPTTIGAVTGSSPYDIGIDTKGTVVVGQSGSGGSTITAFPLTTVGGTTYGPAQNLTQTGAYAGVYGIAFDSTGAFWVGNSAGSSSAGTPPGNTTSSTSVTYSTTTAGAAVTATFGTPSNVTGIFSGGISTGRQVAIDGANNVWIANNTQASSTLFAVSEFNSSGVALSPTSTAGTTTVTENGGFQKPLAVFSGLRGLAIDPSGNVWVSDTGSTANNWVTEIVGAAVPVVTPISAALAANKLGATP